MHYLRCSEEWCSRKNSSFSNDHFPRNRRFLAFGWGATSEFAQIHVENCTKFQDAGRRILLNKSTTVTLFPANVGYCNSFYQAFWAPSREKTRSQKIYCSKRNYIHEPIDVVEYLVVLKREVYTIKQLRELYASIKGAGVTRRGIDMKNLIVKQLEGKVRWCMPKSVKNTQIIKICDICRCQYFAWCD